MQRTIRLAVWTATMVAALVPCAWAQSNGIVVGKPRVYEDELLRSMLATAEASIAQLKFVDQTGIASRIGGIQGATSQQNAVSISANGPSLPGVQTTSAVPTTSSTLKTDNAGTAGTSTGTAGNTTTSSQDTTNTTTNAGATSQTVVNRAAATPATPQLANTGPGFTLPSTFTPAATTTLNEQLQLTFEAANLRLLLEGSLDDRYTPAGVRKSRATIGFPISITPGRRDRKAVAEIEVRVSSVTAANRPAPGPPSLAAVLPRDKTYNVASLTNSSVSVGGGVVTQAFSLGGNFLHSRQTYYLVQDQDTVAEQFPDQPGQTSFGWEFRPVLGQNTVRAGLRQTFAQMTFPVGPEAGCLASVQVITRWRRYDPRSGTLGPAFDEQAGTPAYVRAYTTQLSAYQLTWEDLGDGTLEVVVSGAISGIPPGTRVRVGNTIFDETTPGYRIETQAIRFIVPADLLTLARPRLLTRDGSEIELRDPLHPDPVSAPTGCPGDPTDPDISPASSTANLKIADVTTAPFDASQSKVTITLSDAVVQQSKPALITIGGKTFGLRNAPYQAIDDKKITLLAPTALLRSARVLQAQRLFFGEHFQDEHLIPFADDFTPTALTVLSQDDTQTTFLISGSDMTGSVVIAPPSIAMNPIGSTAATVTITGSVLKTNRQLVLQKGVDPPFVLALPAAPATKPSLKDHDPVTTGTGTVVIGGTLLKQVDSMQIGSTQLFFSASDDGTSVTVNLPDSVTKDPSVLAIHVTFKDGSSTDYKLGVKRP